MIRICPNCGLANPRSAKRCACGFDFESYRYEKSHGTSGDNQDRSGPGLKPNQEGKRNMRIGLIIFFAGIIASVLLTVFSRGAVILIFMSGPVIYGILQFFKGLRQAFHSRK